MTYLTELPDKKQKQHEIAGFDWLVWDIHLYNTTGKLVSFDCIEDGCKVSRSGAGTHFTATINILRNANKVTPCLSCG